MKFFILPIFLLSGTFAFAADPISASQMAKLLSSEYTAPCLAKLYELQKSYDVHVNSYGFKVVEDVINAKNDYTIDYTIVRGGDMAVGSASITVTEKLTTPFGAPPSVKVGHVVSCQFESQIQ